MALELVRLEGISRCFPPAFMALNEIDLRIELGEFIAITGPSGSGKSTLLNVLGLLDRPTSGRYWIDGADTTRLDERRLTQLRSLTIGFVFQAFHLISHLTVLENVLLGLAYAGVPANKRESRATEALESVGMSRHLLAYPPTLSGGEQQRVAIARAYARRPRVLLCDEPTGNLDSSNTEALLELLTATHESDRTLVIVTHDLNVARRSQRILTMEDGHIRSGVNGP